MVRVCSAYRMAGVISALVLSLTGAVAQNLTTAAGATAAASAESEPLCFVREFDQTHLRLSPGRQTRRIAIELRGAHEGAGEASGRAATLWVQGRNHTRPYGSEETCQVDAQGTLTCAARCDEGRFSVDLSADGRGALVRIVSPRLVLNRQCGAANQARGTQGVVFQLRDGERLFQLQRMPPTVCRAMRSGGTPAG